MKSSSRLMSRRVAGSVIVLAALVFLLVAFTGCSGKDTVTNGTPSAAQESDQGSPLPQDKAGALSAKDEVLQRVNLYWKARLDNDIYTMFRMLSRAEPRGSLDPAGYYKRMSKSLRVIGYFIESVELTSEDRATVKVRYAEGLVGMGETFPIESELKQIWSLIDGQWYLGFPEGYKVVSDPR